MRRVSTSLSLLFVGLSWILGFAVFRFSTVSFFDDVEHLDQKRCAATADLFFFKIWEKLRFMDEDVALLRARMLDREGVSERFLNEYGLVILQKNPLLRSVVFKTKEGLSNVLRLSRKDRFFWHLLMNIVAPNVLKNLQNKSAFVLQRLSFDKLHMVFFDHLGNSLQHFSWPKKSVRQALDSPFYQQIIHNRQPNILGPQALFWGGLGLIFSYPITHRVQKLSVSFTFDVEALGQLLGELRGNGVIQAMLVDQKGACLIHPVFQHGFYWDKQKLRRQPLQAFHPYFESVKDAPESNILQWHQTLEKRSLGKNRFFLKAFPVGAQGIKDQSPLSQLRCAVFVENSGTLTMLKQSQREVLLFTWFVIVLIGLVVFVLLRRMTRPLGAAAAALRDLTQMRFDVSFKSRSYFQELDVILRTVTSLIDVLASFGRFVPKRVVGQLLRRGEAASLSGSAKNVTLFFSDIAGFTTIAEGMEPNILANHLSEYFQMVAGLIQDTGGTLDKYIGDAVMAFWGAPDPDALQAVHACEVALRMQQQLEQFNQKWHAEGRPVLKTRIGLMTGPVIVGNVGSKERFQYTALGDSVNVASRLEGLNKIYGTKILVGEPTVLKVKQIFLFRIVDFVAVKGKEKGIHVYELLATKDELAGSRYHPLAVLACETQIAFQLYKSGLFQEALLRYRHLTSVFPEDAVIALFKRRCEFLLMSPPANWVGLWEMSAK